MSEDFSPETSSVDSGPSEGPVNHLAEATRTALDSMGTQGPDPVTGATSSSAQQKAIQQIVDLDKLDKFIWKGKQLTKKEFEDGWLRRADYSKKTEALKQEQAREQQFWDNLKFDLRKIQENPNLIWKFKEIYPSKFHTYADVFLESFQNQGSPAREATKQASIDPELSKYLEESQRTTSEMKNLLNSYREKETEAIMGQLDAYEKKYSQSYPLAEESQVLMNAETLLQKMQEQARSEGRDPNKVSLNEATFERLWKQDHEMRKSRFDAHYQKQVKDQMAANKRGADVPTGGAAGRPAVKSGGIKDARAELNRRIASGEL